MADEMSFSNKGHLLVIIGLKDVCNVQRRHSDYRQSPERNAESEKYSLSMEDQVWQEK